MTENQLKIEALYEALEQQYMSSNIVIFNELNTPSLEGLSILSDVESLLVIEGFNLFVENKMRFALADIASEILEIQKRY